MPNAVAFVFYLAALVCFLISAFGPHDLRLRIFLPLGLALWVTVLTVDSLVAIGD